MVHPLLEPRPAAVTTSTVLAVLAWFTTGLHGVSRVATVVLSFAAGFLAFNAASHYLDG